QDQGAAVLRRRRRPAPDERRARGRVRRGRGRAGPRDRRRPARGRHRAARVADSAGHERARALHHGSRRRIRRPLARSLHRASRRDDDGTADGLRDRRRVDGEPARGARGADSRRRQRTGHARGSCRPAAAPREESRASTMSSSTSMRTDTRAANQLRETTIIPHYLMHAEGSVLIQAGDTKVICAASVEDRVPPFLRNTGKGWVTAEYGMLPRATSTRTQREASAGKVGGRTQEIQRLIGRSLRAVTNLPALGERTVWLDCDVIQADGGTRTASITGAFVALALALEVMRSRGVIAQIPLTDYVAAISVGIVDTEPLLDLAYEDDSRAEVDMNVVKTGNGRFIEVQGTAEAMPFGRDALDTLLDLADHGIKQLVEKQRAIVGHLVK